MKVKTALIFQWFLFGLFITIYSSTFHAIDNVWIVSALFALMLSMIYCEFKRVKKLNSPIIFWYATWLTSIIIGRMDMGLYYGYSEWSSQLKTLIILATITFFVSFWIGSTNKHIEIREVLEVYDTKKIQNIVTVGLVICCVAYSINVLFLGYIPQLSGNVNDVRDAFIATPFYLIIDLTKIVLCLVPLAVRGAKRQTQYNIIALSILLLIMELMTGWRTMVFQDVVLLMSGILYSTNFRSKKEKKKLRKIIVLVAALLLFVVGYIAVTRAAVGNDKAIEYTIQTIYLYLAPNHINFQMIMDNIEPKGYLFYTLEAVWGVFVPRNNMPGFENLYSQFGSFNIANYMLQPYADMGEFGVIMWTALIAFTTSRIFVLLQRKDKVKYLMWNAVGNTIIFTMYAGFYLTNTTAIVWMIIPLIIDFMCTSLKSSKLKKPSKLIGE